MDVRARRRASAFVGAVPVVLLLSGCAGALAVDNTSGAAASAIPSRGDDVVQTTYTTDQAGLDQAVKACAREVLGAYKFPGEVDSMQGAALVDSALAAVGNCVVKKNPEYTCGAEEGMTTGCFYSDTAIEGVYLNGYSEVEAALAKSGAPGY